MALDVIIILIFVVSVWRGKAQGVGDAVIRFISLVLGIGLGVYFAEPVGAMINFTPIDDIIIRNLRELAKSDTINLLEILPKRLAQMVATLGVETTVEVTKIADILILILAFLLIVFVVWIVSVSFRSHLSKSKEKGGFFGTVDSAIGLAYGAFRGALIVMMLLAFIYPIAGLLFPNRIAWITENLNHSYIAGPLYDINPLLLFIRRLPF